MRYNKQELVTLSEQPSNKFDKEGLLYIIERQEGFFRRTEGECIINAPEIYDSNSVLNPYQWPVWLIKGDFLITYFHSGFVVVNKQSSH